MISNIKMPKLFGIVMSLFLLIGLVGCSSDSSKNSDKKSSNESAVTVDTKFGKVEIKGHPKRVVALGWGDAETALSLGVEPIGASDWLAFGGDGVGPWLKGAYKKSPTILGTMELDYEKIASLKPDLILDVKSSGDEERYKRLSEIAPTVGVPKGGDNYLTTTTDQVRMIAQALGKVDKGEELLKDVDVAFDKAAKANPEFAGKTVAVGAYDSSGFGAYVKGDSRVDFVTRLGFKNKEEIEKLAKGNFFIKVADEKLDLLNADLTIVLPIFVDPKEITNNKLYQKIPSVADGRSIILDTNSSNAFSTGTVPALLWAIDNLPQQFKKALEGGE
ncbi:iron-siderophore ABC transporter substrate-binding protein [Gottfriedia acidiceleris]|uniref:iron-siderophore ABC transporter substrate-binding protein n=1 Tax=Gottfriedia acidiceleris TaxID=371036 RepID=UPI002FFDFF82